MNIEVGGVRRAARRLRAVAAFGAVTALLAGCSGQVGAVEQPPAASASTASLCSTPQNPFPKLALDGGSKVLEPNPWNTAGTICVDPVDDTGFTVSQIRDFVPKNPLAPGAYPNVSTAPGASGLPVPVSALGDATADWDANGRVSGSFNLSFDLWYGSSPDNCLPGESAELMVWLDSTDSVRPAGDKVADAQQFGDAAYNVFQAPITGPHSVISYVRTTPTHTTRALDLRLFTADAMARGYVPKGSYLCRVQAGFEVWSGGTGLRSESFAFHNRVGLPVGEIPAGAPGICLRHGGGPGGAVVSVGACGDPGSSTSWTVGNDGSLRGGAACLVPGADRTSVTLADCTGGSGQRWVPTAGGRLMHQDSGLCLGTAGGALADGTAVQLRTCADVVSQRWRIPYNGVA
ncbi:MULTISPECIES: GH12 family glycosyl hydrolase domain-containing protein [Kitasatospora]|uniref:Ricin-type beta-trefoil lectin domain protein n=1 Tax=Kitasatospora cathayae TaxID=3004092 RepID=A0ABY7Q314_9ACTN|nr:ricin-type beta-trefoil lectin domain protein [Kitasatospora sp. HUAS 3-15]WBP87090.1 ricin-type beta-trefoil lectin domain protein [Kitasatospora sp. HUAS 3-15]